LTLGYLLGAVISDPDPRHGAELYDAFPVMRETYVEVEDCVGIPARQILRGEFDPANEHESFSLNAIRLAALAFGINDILAERDIHPGVVGGISLGGLVSSCLAGSVRREDLFRLLLDDGTTPVPEDGSAKQGAAIAFVPVAEDAEWYYGDHRPDIYLGGDFGVLADGSRRLLMLSGTQEALGALVIEAEGGVVHPIEGQMLAVHSPLRQFASDMAVPVVESLEMRDPEIPLCSFLEQRTLTTAAEVRDVFLRNRTQTMYLTHVAAEMALHDTQLALVLGPSLQAGAIRFPFPVSHINTPGQLDDAMAAIYDYGVELPARGSREED
jgi:[acyl-carrier-protein] S-malonyltransferase